MRHVLPLVLTLLLGVPHAAAVPRILGVCQSLLEDRTRCDVETAWSVTKETSTPSLAPQNSAEAVFTVTVTEGATTYHLAMSSVLTLTGLLPEGTQIKGLVVTLQRGDGSGAYASLASAGFGDTSATCGCPNVDSGELSVTIRTLQGQEIPAVEGSVLEYLAYGEHVRVQVDGTYDLSSGLVQPGDPLRIQSCVTYVAGDELDGGGCHFDGGNVRTIRACSPLTLEAFIAPGDAEVRLEDDLGLPEAPFFTLAGFVATVTGEGVSPSTPSALTPGGASPTWIIEGTGVAGRTVVLDVRGQVSCLDEVECAEPEGVWCRSAFDNFASLSSGEVSGTLVEVMCSRERCTDDEVAACDDGNPCTEGLCDPVSGCVQVPRAGPCDDGDVCTIGDHCVDGVCVGAPDPCEAADTCSVGACEPGVGCVFDPLPDGELCDDGDECTGCPWEEPGVARGFWATYADNEPGYSITLPDSYVLWMVGFFGGNHQVKMRGRDDVRMLIFDDGSAVVRGRVYVSSFGGGPQGPAEWDLELTLTPRGRGPAGQGSGGPHLELPAGTQGSEFTDGWRYWNMTIGTLRSADGSRQATFVERPGQGIFPFQLGHRANNRNFAFGASSWFTFYHPVPGGTLLSGIGDINVDLEEVFCEGRDECVAGQCHPGEVGPLCAPLQVGDYCTYTQQDWGVACEGSGVPLPSCLIAEAFPAMVTHRNLCGHPQVFTVGFSEHRQLAFGDPSGVPWFLPLHTPGIGGLSHQRNCIPGWHRAGKYTGEMVSLKLNVELSDARVLPAPRGLPFGDLRVQAGPCEGYKVREVLHRAEMVFGELEPPGETCRGISELEAVMTWLNDHFRGCTEDLGALAP